MVLQLPLVPKSYSDGAVEDIEWNELRKLLDAASTGSSKGEDGSHAATGIMTSAVDSQTRAQQPRKRAHAQANEKENSNPTKRPRKAKDVTEAPADTPASQQQDQAAAAAPAGRIRICAPKTTGGAAPKHAKRQQPRKPKQAAAGAAGNDKDQAPKAQPSTKKQAAADSSQKQPKPKQPRSKAPASADTAAAADKPNKRKPKPSRTEKAVLGFEPARVLAAEYAVAACNLLQQQIDVDDVEPVVTTDDGLPLWMIGDDTEVKVTSFTESEKQATKSNKQTAASEEQTTEKQQSGSQKALLEYLARTATNFPAGKEPFRAFVGGSKKVVEQLTAAVDGRTSKDLAADPAAAAAAEAAAQKIMCVMEQPFADDDARLATAMKQAGDEFWRAYRLATVTEAERVARIIAENEAAATADADAAAASAPAKKGKQGTTKQSKKASNSSSTNAKALKAPSQRPDRVAETKMLNEQFKAVNDRSSFGHVPGAKVNNTWYLRSEVSCQGVHKSPLGGIVSATIPVPIVVNGEKYTDVHAATSICMSGCYEDDVDAASGIITYTGEGGNDLLGDKKQVEHQQLKRGNVALMANIALGIPVRLLRRNKAADTAMNSVLFYDGLYDVVSWVKTLGQQKKVVYIFGLRRRPGQPASLSKPIKHFKGEGTAKRGKDESIRDNLMVRDLTKGKENIPVVVHNDVDQELPPGIDPVADKKFIYDDRNEEDRTAKPLTAYPEPFRYITANEYVDGLTAPEPPKLVEEGSAEASAARAEAAAALATSSEGTDSQAPVGDNSPLADAAGTSSSDSPSAAAAVLTEPSTSAVAAAAGSRLCRKRITASSQDSSWIASKELVIKRAGESPHELLARLNGGNLPYDTRVHKKGDKGVLVTTARLLHRVLIECGDWTGCKDPECNQRQASKGLRYKFEVFKTRNKGWAVRSWDTIKSGTLVCVMYGKIVRAVDVGDGKKYHDSDYFFDVIPRQDVRKGAELFKEDSSVVRHILCSKEQGNVARFINHSCHPNLYVQPLCSGHTDTDKVAIGLFADSTIPAFSELTYDYGNDYIQHQLCGVCLCGADCCKFKPQQEQEQQQ